MQTSLFIQVKHYRTSTRNWNPFFINHLFLSTSDTAPGDFRPSATNKAIYAAFNKFNNETFPISTFGKERGGISTDDESSFSSHCRDPQHLAFDRCPNSCGAGGN